MPGRTPNIQCRLVDAKADPQLLEPLQSSLTPQAFEVRLIRDLAGKVAGRRTFIEWLEQAVPEFYGNVGQYLKSWVASPPSILEKEEEESTHAQPELTQPKEVVQPMPASATVETPLQSSATDKVLDSTELYTPKLPEEC